MSLSELIETEVRRSKAGPGCSVGVAIAQLDADDLAAVTSALDAPPKAVPSSAIERALKAAGLEIGNGAVARHRKALCSCKFDA